MEERKAYPSDVSNEEWAFVAPYLTLMTEAAPQRDYKLAGSIQRAALVSACRSFLADDPPRFATVVGGLTADPALAERWSI